MQFVAAGQKHKRWGAVSDIVKITKEMLREAFDSVTVTNIEAAKKHVELMLFGPPKPREVWVRLDMDGLVAADPTQEPYLNLSGWRKFREVIE